MLILADLIISFLIVYHSSLNSMANVPNAFEFLSEDYQMMQKGKILKMLTTLIIKMKEKNQHLLSQKVKKN